MSKSLRPPRDFHPAGMVLEVELAEIPPSIIKAKRKEKPRGSKRAGIVFESTVVSKIEQLYPKSCIKGPWFKFRSLTMDSLRYCQPDTLLVNMHNKHIVIIEIKLKHNITAWWQLRKLYEPVTRKFFGNEFTFSCVEIVKNYDPSIKFPEPYYFTDKLDIAEDNRFSVCLASSLSCQN